MRFKKLRIGIAVVALAAILSGIGYIFWQQEVKYRLPTPPPANYAPPAVGERIDLRGRLGVEEGKPIFIHFFNPGCPCSRFNVPHVKALMKAYRKELAFRIVVLDKENTYTEQEIQERYGFDVPVSFDASIAGDCGVYSTPQAVLLSAEGRLYYRGNYNRSRYCTDASTAYAQMAIDSFLQQRSKPIFSQYALTAYGCELPNCVR